VKRFQNAEKLQIIETDDRNVFAGFIERSDKARITPNAARSLGVKQRSD
jgi:hypothetical protein